MRIFGAEALAELFHLALLGLGSLAVAALVLAVRSRNIFASWMAIAASALLIWYLKAAYHQHSKTAHGRFSTYYQSYVEPRRDTAILMMGVWSLLFTISFACFVWWIWREARRR